MAANKQDQRVSQGGQALQAGNDLTVYNGLTEDQVEAIMVRVVQKAVTYTIEAKGEVDRRLVEFRAEILEELKKPDRMNAEAFREPDFQYMIGEAQDAYARSGEPAVRDTLVDIIARRSKQPNATRLALTLNDAASRAPKLTPTEFATLSLVYIVRYTTHRGINNIPSFNHYITENYLPFVTSDSKEISSLRHIESQSCGRLSSISAASLRNLLILNYGGLLGKGLPLDEIYNSFPAERHAAIKGILVTCVRDEDKWQPNATSLAVLLEQVGKDDLVEHELNAVWNGFAGTIPSDQAFSDMLEADIPGFAKLYEIWEKSQVKSLELNNVGIAIGHANAVRLKKFEAPLETWIT